ncbi:hypothetical protein QBC38DRAFT_459244 [Podospora fimiseda]|uniref:Uncharacterized protein n=1 Tax=Podospora fimiseda TaxID=252190 RepID=A0AAN7BHK6_9PEZI|nr:hypothetical protein QBC38DRAFT_459244 [Podospora fimiseda]
MCKFNHYQIYCDQCNTICAWVVLDAEFDGEIFEIKQCANPSKECLKGAPRKRGKCMSIKPCAYCAESYVDEQTGGNCEFLAHVEWVGLDPNPRGNKVEKK